jgi:uncharacterized phage-associated protein
LLFIKKAIVPHLKMKRYGYIPKEIKELLDEVYAMYGQYSAWKLSQFTHEEPTWINHVNEIDKTIPQTEMATFFKTLLKTNS